MAAQHQQFGPLRLGGRRVRLKLRDQLVVVPLLVECLRQRNGHLGAAHAEFQRLLQRRFGGRGIRAAQVGLPEQDLRGDHLRIFLQRILQLHDRALKIVGFEA